MDFDVPPRLEALIHVTTPGEYPCNYRVHLIGSLLFYFHPQKGYQCRDCLELDNTIIAPVTNASKAHYQIIRILVPKSKGVECETHDLQFEDRKVYDEWLRVLTVLSECLAERSSRFHGAGYLDRKLKFKGVRGVVDRVLQTKWSRAFYRVEGMQLVQYEYQEAVGEEPKMRFSLQGASFRPWDKNPNRCILIMSPGVVDLEPTYWVLRCESNARLNQWMDFLEYVVEHKGKQPPLNVRKNIGDRYAPGFQAPHVPMISMDDIEVSDQPAGLSASKFSVAVPAGLSKRSGGHADGVSDDDDDDNVSDDIIDKRISGRHRRYGGDDDDDTFSNDDDDNDDDIGRSGVQNSAAGRRSSTSRLDELDDDDSDDSVDYGYKVSSSRSRHANAGGGRSHRRSYDYNDDLVSRRDEVGDTSQTKGKPLNVLGDRHSSHRGVTGRRRTSDTTDDADSDFDRPARSSYSGNDRSYNRSGGGGGVGERSMLADLILEVDDLGVNSSREVDDLGVNSSRANSHHHNHSYY